MIHPVMLMAAVLALAGMGLGACVTAPAAAPVTASFAPPPAVLIEAWIGPVEETRSDRAMIFYRAYGGGAYRLGAWLSPTPPVSRQGVREAMALPPQNTAEFYSVVTVPAGTLMKVGVAAPAFDQPGGGAQVQLLELIPQDSFSEPIPLP
ncbi:MAG: TNT domain-containing protein [Alphaproteobacteria bacterium]|nr:TNT domain-containing protein [Alphaproteobacteria bacterium]MBU2378369.1 TNT domain-containing protein [Alphaproteobacteria bacterium]